MRSSARFRRQVLTLSTGLLPILLSVGTAYAQEPGTFWDYRGVMGDSAVGFTFVGDANFQDSLTGKQLRGTYFFIDQLKDFAISGHSGMDRSIELFQRDEEGEVIAHFVGTFPKRDPRGIVRGRLGDGIITGRWYMGKDTLGLPVFLELEDVTNRGPDGRRYSAIGATMSDSAFESAVRYFRKAVLEGDTSVVARRIVYPIPVDIDGKNVEIRSASALLRNYAKIFYPEFIAALRKCVPHDMFVRPDEGAGLGRYGMVWFNGAGKVSGLYNDHCIVNAELRGKWNCS